MAGASWIQTTLEREYLPQMEERATKLNPRFMTQFNKLLSLLVKAQSGNSLEFGVDVFALRSAGVDVFYCNRVVERLPFPKWVEQYSGE
jgi:hypothetical protein